MKINKKIILGLATAVSLLTLFVIMPAKSLAADPFNLYFNSDKSQVFGTYGSSGYFVTFTTTKGPGTWTYFGAASSAICLNSKFTLTVQQQRQSGGVTVPASQVNISYHPSGPGSACQAYNGNLSIAAKAGAPPPASPINWTGAKGVVNPDGSTLTVTFSDGSQEVFKDGTPSDTTINFKPTTAGKMGGTTVLNWCDNTTFGSSQANFGITLASYKATTGKVVVCYNYGNGNFTEGDTTPINISVDTSGYTGPAATGTVAADNSCEANYNGPAHVFNWVFCGILEGMDAMFGTIHDQVEAQLNICTGKSSTTGETCGNNLLTPQVEKSWAVFRDLATALLVIIMLVMVFSQAVSFGPFDAYTVRKMLPKIVAAVILMQISWPLFKFFVDLSNDLGRGIEALMLAPFGGPKSLSFDNLIGAAGNFAPSVATAGLFTALLIGGVLSGITIMGVALLGASAILSVVVGLLVLLFRQMLIIIAMIMAPIALVAWILPGTQKYWKLWSDNFIKLLLMFPLIMAMIAAGKIFGKIGVDTGTGIFGVIIVFVGFLGPLWFLPKTFRWGGQIFAAAASGTLGATKGLRSSPGKYAMSQAKINRQQRAADRNERISYGRARIGDRFLSAAGGIGLTPRGRSLRESRDRAEGREAGEKAVAQAIVGSQYESQDHQAKLVTLDYLAQGQTDPATGLDGSNPAMQRWALDQLATFGDWDRIDLLRANGNLDERVWQTFMAKNISAVHQNAPYLSPLRRDMSQLGYHEAATWKDHAVHEFERQVMTGKIRTADGRGYEDAPDKARQLALGVDFATRALSDERVRANLSADAIATFERIRDMGSPTVTVSEARGSKPAEAHLPSALMVQNNAEARRSLTTSLISPNKTTSTATRQALAQRLADPVLDDESRNVLENYLDELRNQAESSRSPEVVSAYNETLQQWKAILQQRPEQAERDALARGLSGPDLAQARAGEQEYVNSQLARIDTIGLRPLP